MDLEAEVTIHKNRSTVMRHFMTGMRSEKCAIRRFLCDLRRVHFKARRVVEPVAPGLHTCAARDCTEHCRQLYRVGGVGVSQRRKGAVRKYSSTISETPLSHPW